MLRLPRNLQAFEGGTPKQLKAIADVNREIKRVAAARGEKVEAAGALLKSKLAWKLTTYQQALLHRVVSLFDGVALALNERSTLTAMLAGRALMETVATFGDLLFRVQAMLDDEDLEGLDALAMKGMFATRDPKFLANSPDTAAQNVMTVLKRFEKQRGFDGFIEHYDRLSERCHPNSLGHHFMFGKLDAKDGTVRYSDEQEPGHNRNTVLGAALTVAFVASWSAALTAAIEKVAQLQDRLNPVGP